MGAGGGLVEKKPDSTGNGALAEMAKVCTNVKCLFSCSWGRDRRPQKGPRVPVGAAARLRLKGQETSPHDPSREKKHVTKRPTRTKTKAEETQLGRLKLPVQHWTRRRLLSNPKVVEVTLDAPFIRFSRYGHKYSRGGLLRHSQSCRCFRN